MTNNNFTNNSADYLGGAVYWNYYNPNYFINETYVSNTAGVYGDNLASFSQVLKTIIPEDYEKMSNGSTRR